MLMSTHVMKSVSIIITFLTLGLLVFKYISSANSILDAVDPERVVSLDKTVSGRITSCRIIEVFRPEPESIDEQVVYKVLMTFKDGAGHVYPISLNGGEVLGQIEKVCDHKGLVNLEFTSINKRLEKHNFKHVKKFIIFDSGVVINNVHRIR